MSYKNELKHKKWRALRLVVLNRDNNKCTICQSTKKLHVHHNKYITGARAWEVPIEYLQTMCETCHNEFHKMFDASTLVDNSIEPIINAKIKRVIKNKPKKDITINGIEIRIANKKLKQLAKIDGMELNKKIANLRKEAKLNNQTFATYTRNEILKKIKH
jgi:hypothetical protein